MTPTTFLVSLPIKKGIGSSYRCCMLTLVCTANRLVKLGSPQPRLLTALECSALYTLQWLRLLVGTTNWFRGSIRSGRGGNFLREFIVWGGILSRGTFALGGCLTWGLWFGVFCGGAFCGRPLTRYLIIQLHCNNWSLNVNRSHTQI